MTRLADLLTAIELREAELLTWGAVGAWWTEAELLALLAEHGAGRADLAALTEAALVVRTPDGAGFRSRSAETIRLLATLRQSFPSRRVTEGRPLVLDHRFLHRPRRRPERNLDRGLLLDQVSAALGRSAQQTASLLAPETVSGFQLRSASAVLGALRGGQSAGVMITAGTGSGKTLAFYLPLLSWLTDQMAGTRHGETVALALYPRNELLKDQLRTIVRYLRRIRAAGGPAISIATWFGLTPSSSHYVANGWVEGWQPDRRNGFLCPFLRCVDCPDGDLYWSGPDLKAQRERLTCANCGTEIDDGTLRLTRDSARERPAHLMLSTTESLNRQLAAPGSLAAFGVHPATLSAVLLDEVHTYQGTTGAQNAILLRRLKHRLGGRPLTWVGLSATLHQAPEFFARLVGLPPGHALEVTPQAEELVEDGAEYLLALRSDPHSGAGTLSTSIQTAMVLARSLDKVDDDDLFSEIPSSNRAFGSRLFVFTDKLDSTNRLYWDLLDAEGLRWPGVALQRRPLTLAHLRSAEQSRLRPGAAQAAADRDADGQWWWMPEYLGHGIEDDQPLIIDRTSSQDRGVAANAQVVVATATLEVGFDDDRVGAVLQHKAPHDAAQFLQRKGRAGRHPATRPWTVVVLSDWGRDRFAWDGYEALFDPELPPRNLPLENLYVLRIQAVYALLDWLGIELRYRGRDSVWADLCGPAELLHQNADRQKAARARQLLLAELLGGLMHPGPERERLRRHVRDALSLEGEWGDSLVDTLFWEAPRPLLLAVVPTIHRQLQDQWRGEEPADDDRGIRSRTPLRQFVPGNLFEDLIVPDVELRLPGASNVIMVEHLPALRTLREFCPGNVTRHFGIWAANKRHWIPLPEADPTQLELRVDVRQTYRGTLIDVIGSGDRRVPVYSPVAATLEGVNDEQVRDASTVRPDWEFEVTPFGQGKQIDLTARTQRLIAGMTAHLHAHGGGVRTVRFARTAHGTIWRPRPEPVRLKFGAMSGELWEPAALGVDVHADALQGRTRMPDRLPAITGLERAQRLRQVLTAEASLPETMSDLDRTTLAGCVLLGVARAGMYGAGPLTGPGLRDHLDMARADLGVGSRESTGDGEVEDWEGWLRDLGLLAAVEAAINEVTARDRSPAWIAWWRHRYTLSSAQLTLAALGAMCPGLDIEELMVDLDPSEDDVFWLSERSPGGTGQVEAFHLAATTDPDSFGRALEDALRPSETETMDAELVTLLRFGSGELDAALHELRGAWRLGHSAVAGASHAVDGVVSRIGLRLGGPARSVLSTRLAGPGAHPDLLETVRSWVDLRDRADQASGLAVDGRTLGGLLAHEIAIDPVLRLDGQVDSRRRARAVANLLWPWADTAQADITYNPYAPSLRVDFDDIRRLAHLGPVRVEAAPWNDDRRAEIHQALLDEAEIVLRCVVTDRRELRAALLDLQTTPVEVGTLLCHPVVVGVTAGPDEVSARLLLREAQ
ncbi:protein DpdJ [Micromonospora cathayae]|uniref:Protein DpdJ n=1 Tax=Micromonospora cathayae TaxID=3028804 RepID=A0ABY7ZNY3_9ACTN|nr:protein DpdJ [Micromonospora sp. HUAS 3]WDZ84709.1 protein DpdJ [Micromonospora sp. HUAS 3]